MNRVAGPIHFLADWTIGLAFVAAILSIGLATLGPQTPWHLSVTYELTPKQGQVGTVRISPTYYRPFASPSKANQPSSRIKRSGQPTEVAIDAGLQEQAVPEYIGVYLSWPSSTSASQPLSTQPAGTVTHPPQLVAYPPDAEYLWQAHPNRSQHHWGKGLPGKQAFARLWSAVNASPTQSPAREQIQEISAAVKALADGQHQFTLQHFDVADTRNFVYTAPAQWALWAMLLGWCAVYVGGLVFYFARYRRWCRAGLVQRGRGRWWTIKPPARETDIALAPAQ